MAWQLRPILLIGAFLPDSEHGSGIGDCMDGGGHCPEKGEFNGERLAMKLKPKEKPKEVTGHPTQPHWHDMNRKQRRETIRKFQSEDR